ncbi:hypothetical protein JTB14_001672 [Gonioctena quinquepunctata]|nr:hypothetical protein JTB14_001672 [Gonioctena quinquepunctata]
MRNVPRKENSKKTHSKIFTSTPNREAKERKNRLAKNKQVKRNIDSDEKKIREKSTNKREPVTDPRFLCEEFGKDGEWWLVCINCGMAAHSECTGCDRKEDYTYLRFLSQITPYLCFFLNGRLYPTLSGKIGL